METDIDRQAQNVVQLLNRAQLHIATAESCTGGLISSAITSVSGSSAVFDLGVCTYANWAKNKLLGVPQEMLEKFGAVSEQVAVAMADGIKKAAGSDFSVSVTGIAGPGGGTADKPLGTVYIGISTPEKTRAEHFVFTVPDNSEEYVRDYVRRMTVQTALSLLLCEIEKYI